MSDKVYSIITNQIIQAIEKNQILPWQRSWSVQGSRPINLISKKPYRGVNLFILAMQGFSSPYWITKKQVLGLGARIKREEFKKSMKVIWYCQKKYEDKNTGEIKAFPVLLYYTVWNIEQCEVSEKMAKKIPTLKSIKKVDNQPIEEAKAIIENMPKKPVIKHVEQKAYYMPKSDYVNMPKFESFENSESYYSVCFHELVHATGHKSRLNRPEITSTNSFGSHEYSKEELTAELGACFLRAEAGIERKEEMENSVAYVGSWIKKLQSNPKWIVQASGKAQKASDFILDRKVEFAK